MNSLEKCNLNFCYFDRGSGAIEGRGGLTGTKKHWRPHSANIYYPLYQSCIAYIARYWLCIDKRSKAIRWIFVNFEHKVPSVVFSGWNTVANVELKQLKKGKSDPRFPLKKWQEGRLLPRPLFGVPVVWTFLKHSSRSQEYITKIDAIWQTLIGMLKQRVTVF